MANLYINACTRKDSRTSKIANNVLEKLGNFETINLYDLDIKPIDEDFINRRSNLISLGNYNDRMFDLAKKVASADNIVIAAPFWDLSFPSILKVFIENIYCIGIVTEYDSNGNIVKLCKGNCLYYVSTSGANMKEDYGYKYISDIFVNYFGFKKSKLIKAEMLDIDGSDADKIVNDVIENIKL